MVKEWEGRLEGERIKDRGGGGKYLWHSRRRFLRCPCFACCWDLEQAYNPVSKAQKKKKKENQKKF
jgi:hypothetical protein